MEALLIWEKSMESPRTKADFRNLVFQLRRQMSDAEADRLSGEILSRLRRLPVYINASRIYVYLDFGKEVRTRGLIEDALAAGKEVALPRIHDREMDFYPYVRGMALEKNSFGIEEPAEGSPVFWEDALMILPGVAFDRFCSRIGYGGGYYDRYLEQHPSHDTVALAFSAQVFDQIPCDDKDIRPDRIVTEKEIIT